MNPTERHSILLVDDEGAIRRVLASELGAAGFEVATAGDATAARELLDATPFDAMILDVRLPGMSGDQMLPSLREEHPHMPVVMLTGHADVELAVHCMREGAADLVTKPCSVDHLAMALRRAIDVMRLRESNRLLTRHARAARPARPRLIGNAPSMQRLRDMIRRVSPSDEPVLVIGESGTGKELIAREIQTGSPRAQKPFITVNCAAVAESLLESELFGHEKGAFSGAIDRRLGFFELAHEGTIFLDEIGDMPLSMQPKLLRVLQSGEFRRVGGGRVLHADVRVIAATNRPLHEEVRAGRFREDLFHRINTIQLESPPLRERTPDLEELIDSFLDEVGGRGQERHRLSPEALVVLRGYAWPGNVRELRNVIRRAVILAERPLIEVEDLPRHIREEVRARQEGGVPLPVAGREGAAATNPLDQPLEEVERRHILAVLRDSNGNKTHAARRLGVSVKTLYNKLEAWGLSVSDLR